MTKQSLRPAGVDLFYSSVIKQDLDSVLKLAHGKTVNSSLQILGKEYLPYLIKKLTNTDLDTFLQKFWKLFQDNIDNLNTLSKASTILKSLAPDNPVIKKVINLTPEQKGRLIEANQSSRDSKNRQLQVFRKDHIDEILNRLETEEDQKSLCAYLLLATGRRLIELVISDFKFKSPNFLIFGQRAKSRSDDETKNDEFLIPVYPFGTAKFILDKIDLFRSTFPDDGNLTNEELTKNLDERMNNFLSNIFEQQVTCHTCRKIYAAITYPIYNENESLNAYIQRVLIHKELSTSLNYSTVRID